jgi:HEAT repeat protein
MNKNRWILRTFLIAGCTFAAVAAAGLRAGQAPGQSAAVHLETDEPKLENAQRETQAIHGGVASSVDAITQQSDKALWIAYSVARVADGRSACCGNYNDGEACGTCRLESTERGMNFHGSGAAKNDTAKLEDSERLLVLLRAENHKVMRVRMASEDCKLDVGGLRFVWLGNADAIESVQYLSKFVLAGNFTEHEHQSLGNDALAAIALHADAAADRAFENFTAANQPEELRRKASFWLGEARGKNGLELLRKMAKNDPSAEVRAQVTFALSVSREPAAVDEMIRMAHEDESGHVRGQALFWLAQKAGKKAVGAISGAIENDPETDVKKKAVFALSQLPKDEGVPKLIEVAQSNRNPEVRKQAMFWLGQSNDPRALQFFEKVLTQ